ncbi:XdhC family protein [Loktanella agnita]|uniref:XdhC family protein n=1 Tax=Loktanella agnita TaxID=287097 RepID=UPI0039873657
MLKALEKGEPQLISIAPDDVLSEKGHKVGEIVDGVAFARNGCPSRGTIDMFVEPYLPRPELVVFGASPVAQALADLAPRFDWATRCLDAGQVPQNVTSRQRAIVIATQGQGDLQALQTALASPSRYVGFVGSRLKFAALSAKLATENVPTNRIARVQAPAGLDIGAITPEEIALSILAALTQQRRRPATDIAE